MKKKLIKCMMVVLASVFVSVFTINTSNAQGRVSLQVFYDELEPHGTWMNYQGYGYVWVPRVDRGFTPYGTGGYWVNTEYGNTWVSDYSWGWAPFHYGRWFYDDFYGWVWVPDTEWAPAWVAWRNGGGYYGWAPLTPGLGFSVAVAHYNRIPDYHWHFVPHRHIMHRHVHNYYVPRPRVVNVIHHTTIVTNNYHDRRHTYFTGPSRRDMERDSRSRVEVHKISDRSQPGRMDVSRRTVNVYRPEIDDSRESKRSAMPSNVVRDDRRSREQVDARNDRTIEPVKRERSSEQRRELTPVDNSRREQQTRERKEVSRDNNTAVERLKKSERDNKARELEQRNFEQRQRKEQVEKQRRNTENPRRETDFKRQETERKQRNVSEPQRRLQNERQQPVERQVQKPDNKQQRRKPR